MRLIDAHDVLGKIEKMETVDVVDVVESIMVSPTVDAVPVIRCKDCKHWNANNDTHRCFVWCMYTCSDGYCHRAERKEE